MKSNFFYIIKKVKFSFNASFSRDMGLGGAQTPFGAGEFTGALHLKQDALSDETIT